MSIAKHVLIVAAVIACSGCTVKKTEAPPLAGPSELALRLGLQVVPDSILQDGASQAVISVDASNGDGRVARGLALRVELVVDGVIQDFGTLSAKTIVTGDDGRARVVYTAPPRPAAPVDEYRTVDIYVTPIGTDYAGEEPRRVTLRLIPPGVILPPNAAPVPNFSMTPEAPLPLQTVVFDASSSLDEGLSCGASCTYRWEFGDGSTATGIFVTHQYRTMGNYQLRLTVTDQRGASATLARPVVVGEAIAPTAVFTFSPTPAETGQVVFFNAEQSTAAPGRRIVSYDWDFGSGRTATGITTSKTFENPGTYTVTLVVVDDAGARGTTSREVTIGNVDTRPGTSLNATLVVTPTSTASTPAPLSTVFLFDASGSSGPSRIVEYRFNMGDGSPDAVQPTLPTWSYQYRTAGIYNVRVTVRDVQGRTATATRTIYVQ
jgi:PKD repeat protein